MAGDSAATPSEIGFEVVRRGYDQGQVESHLRRLDAEISILVTDRDAAMDQSAQLTRELDDSRLRAERLRAQVRTLVTPPQSVQGMSERLRSMLRLAEDEVAEMLGRADTEVRRRTGDAEVAAAATIAQAQAHAETILAGAGAEADAMADELARSRAGAESRQALVEQDFTIAMDQRRAEAIAALGAETLEARRDIEADRQTATTAARQTTSDAEATAHRTLSDARSQANLTLADARATAQRTVADAERRCVELVALRHELVEQLTGTRLALDHTLDALVPLPEETGAAVTAEPVAAEPASAGPADPAPADGDPADGDPADGDPADGDPTDAAVTDAAADGTPAQRPSPQRRARRPAPAGRR